MKAHLQMHSHFSPPSLRAHHMIWSQAHTPKHVTTGRNQDCACCVAIGVPSFGLPCLLLGIMPTCTSCLPISRCVPKTHGRPNVCSMYDLDVGSLRCWTRRHELGKPLPGWLRGLHDGQTTDILNYNHPRRLELSRPVTTQILPCLNLIQL
jgi:hypothetical protein